MLVGPLPSCKGAAAKSDRHRAQIQVFDPAHLNPLDDAVGPRFHRHTGFPTWPAVACELNGSVETRPSSGDR